MTKTSRKTNRIDVNPKRRGALLNTLTVIALSTFAIALPLGGNTIVKADSHISKTETIDGVTIQTFYNNNQIMIRQVRTSKEGDTTVIRTVDGNGAIVEITRTTETAIPDDPTIVNDDPSLRLRVVRTKRYVPGSRRPVETVVLEETTKLFPTTERLAVERKIVTTTYSQTKPRTKVKTVVEQGRFVEFDDYGVPIFEGRRTTTTPDGKKVEILDRGTQRWRVVSDEQKPGEKPTDGAGVPSTRENTASTALDPNSPFCEQKITNFTVRIAQLRVEAGQELLAEFTK